MKICHRYTVLAQVKRHVHEPSVCTIAAIPDAYSMFGVRWRFCESGTTWVYTHRVSSVESGHPSGA